MTRPLHLLDALSLRVLSLRVASRPVGAITSPTWVPSLATSSLCCLLVLRTSHRATPDYSHSVLRNAPRLLMLRTSHRAVPDYSHFVLCNAPRRLGAARGAGRACSPVSKRYSFPGSPIPAAPEPRIADTGFIPTSTRPRVGVDAGRDGSSRVRRTRGSAPPTSRGTRRSRPSASSSRLRPEGVVDAFVRRIRSTAARCVARSACVPLLALRGSQRGASSGARRGAADRPREA